MTSVMIGVIARRAHDSGIDVDVVVVVVDPVFAIELFVLLAKLGVDESAYQRPEHAEKKSVEKDHQGDFDGDMRGVGEDGPVIGEKPAWMGLGGSCEPGKHENDSHLRENDCQFDATTAARPGLTRLATIRARPATAGRRARRRPAGSEPSMASKTTSAVDSIISLAKRRGFVYQCGEIYGGTKSAWDYGPLGVELKDNIKRQWWRAMVQTRDDIVGLDSSVILPTEVWEASGHLAAFVDPLVECTNCHKRFRQDQLQEEYAERKGLGDPDAVAMADLPCPHCGTKGAWTEPRMFNGLLKTFLGPVETEEGLHYLRPETAQGIFINFMQVMTTARKKPPFGIAQIGKSFRNEITPGNFIFRTREFEQMEMEFFVRAGTDEEWHQRWIDERTAWYVGLGISPDNLRHFEHPQEKLSHYSKRTVDIEYRFQFAGSEWGELEGIANRTDFDLSTHSQHSGQELAFFDQATGERWTPYVIEPAAGVNRSMMAFLVDAYDEDEAPNAKGGVDTRVLLRLDPRLAPVKVAVLPLSRNEQLSPAARDLAAELRGFWNVEFDDAGAIGRRYRRQDEIGTPFCVTVDFDTLDDQAVTIRERDTMAQERIALGQVREWLGARLPGC